VIEISGDIAESGVDNIAERRFLTSPKFKLILYTKIFFQKLKNLVMTNIANNSDDKFKKPGRSNWLRNAAMVVTGTLVLLLVLTGCTKEQWDHLKHGSGGGDVGSGPSDWYKLKVTYKTTEGKLDSAYMGPIGEPSLPAYWDYMQIGGGSGAKFRLHPGQNGFEYWEMDNGYWLSIRYDGWLWETNMGDRVGWKIVNGQLFTDYSRWSDGPMGTVYRSALVTNAYYVGAELGADAHFTCELVPTTPPGN